MDMNVLEVNGSEYDVADAVARESIETLRTDTETELANKANVDGNYEGMTVGNALELVSTVKENDQVPYYYRTTAGNAEAGDRAYINAIVGASAVVNQLIQDGNFTDATKWVASNATLSIANNIATITATAQWGRVRTLPISVITGHKYLVVADIKGATSNYLDAMNFGNVYVTQAGVWQTLSIVVTASVTSASRYVAFGDRATSDWASFQVKNAYAVDLTALFGYASVADYLSTLDTASRGSGYTKFKSWGFDFSNLGYTDNTLESISGLSEKKTTGLNQWDEEWEVGVISVDDGTSYTVTNAIRSKNFCPCVGGANYYLTCGDYTNKYYLAICWYDADKNFISGIYANRMEITAPSNAVYFKITTNIGTVYGNTYKNDICIIIHWDNTYDGVYEPYVEHTYPLDDSITLRGIYKLDSNNNLYADGDRWLPSGEVERRYGVVDLGTLNWVINPNAENAFTGTLTARAISGTKNAICSLYIIDDSSTVGNVDKAIAIGKGSSNNKVYAHDSAYSDASAFKTAMSGVYLIYELATPTTEEATPYTTPQIVDNWGTEEFVTTSPIPIGHDTDYPISIKDKVEAMADSPTSDGIYVLTRANGQNTYTPLASTSVITSILSRLEALENA